mmetsp:Transcript_5950/g.12393  ORF Transcript_5950/g.12393 Transcript_5950/m.12393 type:complete len:233 (-) Transcript_5950:74-772(-)
MRCRPGFVESHFSGPMTYRSPPSSSSSAPPSALRAFFFFSLGPLAEVPLVPEHPLQTPVEKAWAHPKPRAPVLPVQVDVLVGEHARHALAAPVGPPRQEHRVVVLHPQARRRLELDGALPELVVLPHLVQKLGLPVPVPVVRAPAARLASANQLSAPKHAGEGGHRNGRRRCRCRRHRHRRRLCCCPCLGLCVRRFSHLRRELVLKQEQAGEAGNLVELPCPEHRRVDALSV